MNVRLKLFATHRRYLPHGIEGSACDLKVPAGTQIADLLTQFDIPADDRASVILVNGHSTTPAQVLEEGDVVAVFPSMAGG